MKNKFYKRLIKSKRVLEYLEVIIIPKFRFKRALKKSKSILLSYPMSRCIGKSTLIARLMSKYNIPVLTKYSYYLGNRRYIRFNNIHAIRHCDNKIFLVDGIQPEWADYLIKNEGLTLIGYIR